MEEMGSEGGRFFFCLVCDVVRPRIAGEDETAARRRTVQGSGERIGDGGTRLAFICAEDKDRGAAGETVCSCVCVLAVV